MTKKNGKKNKKKFFFFIENGNSPTFASKKKDKVMTAIALERETNNYWALIRDVSREVKLALISRLSIALIMEETSKKNTAKSLIDEITANAPQKGQKEAPFHLKWRKVMRGSARAPYFKLGLWNIMR